MKSYANFLLLENLLYNISGASASIKTLSESIFNPRVKVVEEDCSPGIGTQMPLSVLSKATWLAPNNQQTNIYPFLLDLSGAQLTSEVISTAISEGKRDIMVRHTGSCNSSGGICKVCLYASVLQSTANFVDSSQVVQKTYYDMAIPPMEELLLPEVGNSVTLWAGIGKSKVFFQPSERAYFSWVANTYSGSMLGINAYDTFPTPIKHSLARASINKNLLASALGELTRIKDMPSNYIDYLDGLEDDLEKAMTIILLYTVYGDATLGAFPSTFSPARDIVWQPA